MRPFETTLTKQKVQFDCLNSGGPEEEGAKWANFDIHITLIHGLHENGQIYEHNIH